jgi:hypothetical protein
MFRNLVLNIILMKNFEFGTSTSVKQMMNFHDLYLKTDVLLLADILEKFTEMSLRNYGLDPVWYYTAPGLSYADAALKMTGEWFGNITDPNMYLMIQDGIRGGISMISKRHAKANNKLKDYDPSEPSVYIPYSDENNMYGWAMCQKLPCRDFDQVDE